MTTQANGNVIVNYNNGQTRTIAQIPLITFNAPNALQSQNGQSFTATPSSGTPLAEAAGTNGAGNLVTGSIEGSNVDIATEFSKLDRGAAGLFVERQSGHHRQPDAAGHAADGRLMAGMIHGS